MLLFKEIMPFGESFQTLRSYAIMVGSLVNDHYFIVVHRKDASDLFFQRLYSLYVICVEHVLA
jgi:hypothetical protein